MAKNTQAASSTGPKKRKAKSVTLLMHVEEYLEGQDLTLDDEIGSLIAKLRDTIVDEAKAKARA